MLPKPPPISYLTCGPLHVALLMTICYDINHPYKNRSKIFTENYSCEQKQLENSGIRWLAERKEEVGWGRCVITNTLLHGHFLSSERVCLEAIPSIPPLPVSALESDSHIKRVGGKNPLSTTLGFWEATEL